MEVALATGLRRLMMNTIGLIGGMSWESTAVYYRRLSEQVVILGCTEIGLLIRPENIDLPAFDSTLLHADAAVEFALGDGPLGRADAA
jgi:aspartate/glutamate racemase